MIQKYRIDVINDFKASKSYIQYLNFGFGQMEHFDACQIKVNHKGFTESTDSIRVYLNHKLVGMFVNKKDASELLTELMNEAPENLTEYKYVFDVMI